MDKDAIPGKEGQTGFFPRESMYGSGSSPLAHLRLALGDELHEAALPTDEFVGHSQYYVLAQDVPVRREIPPESISKLFDLSIAQDGRAVPLASVVAEAALTDVGSSGGRLEITFHFRHSLAFTAGSSSEVRVRYAADYAEGGDNQLHLKSYSYSYILGTGRTWRGAIGRLYFAVPPAMDPKLPKAFQRLGRLRGKDVYLAAGYEPEASDRIEAAMGIQDASVEQSYFKAIWFDTPRTRERPNAPAQDFVSVKGASSSLADAAPGYTFWGVLPKAGFGALSLFDGIPETAWAEGAKGDGIGEWIEFELAKDVEALDIQNGFNMSFVKVEGKAIDTYYEKNNRPKTLEIASSDGAVKKIIALADTKELQSFEKVFLPRGRYKLFIRDVCKGSKWQDCCLGEIIFTPASPRFTQLGEDAFLKAHETELVKEGL